MLRFLNLNNSGFRPEEAARNLALKKHKFFWRFWIKRARVFLVNHYDNKEENNQNNYHLIRSVFKISNHPHTNKIHSPTKSMNHISPFHPVFIYFLHSSTKSTKTDASKSPGS